MSLSPAHQQLLASASQGDLGIIQYGTDQLRESLHILNGDGYQWKPETLLWEGMNKEVVEHQFFQKTCQSLNELREAVVFLPVVSEEEKNEKTAILKTIHKAVTTCQSVSKMTANFKKILGCLPANSGLNGYTDSLPVKGGQVVCLRTGKLTPRTREHLWSFEVEATGKSWEHCTAQAKADVRQYHENLFKNRAGEIDQELMFYFRRLTGYWMTLENTDKSLYFCLGPNDCGKSDSMDRMLRILKQRITVCSSDVFIDMGSSSNHKTFLARLVGVSMAFVQELPNRPIKDDVLKAISGSDQIAFRGCGKDKEQDLKSGCSLVACCNSAPKFNGADPGMAVRVVKIPFRRNHLTDGTPVEREENGRMLRRLDEQDGKDALFAWWLEGSKEYFELVNNGTTRIPRPAIVALENEELLEDSNSWEHFLRECADIWSAGGNVPIGAFTWERSKLKTAYSKFCIGKYTGNQLLDKTQVVEKIKFMFNQPTRGPFVGIRPKPESADNLI
jgi:phage/plasmid-associated DNA primase